MFTKEWGAISQPKTEETALPWQQKYRQWIGAGILAALLLFALLLALVFGKPLIAFVADSPRFQQWVQDHRFTGTLAFVGIRAVQTVLTILPAEAVEIGAGYTFGAFGGLVWCIVGSAAGSAIIYLFTKWFGIRLTQYLIPLKKIQSLSFIQETKRRNLLTFLIFIIPGTPKDTLTYLVGLTPMRLSTFLVISSVARIPSILTSTLCGSALCDKNYLFAGIVFGITGIISLLGIVAYRHMIKKKDHPV